jgi:serine/threonine protein kinase
MDAARWNQIDQLVDAALEMPAIEREKFVTLEAGNDSNLRIQVLQLLAAQDEGDDFLNRSAMQVAAKAMIEDETEISAFAFVNKTVAKYKIERLLGAGGMGEVYLAFDEKLRRKVALKILPSEFVSNDERVKRFELEARAISSMNHPNIVTIYDVGNFEGVNYIATEFVEGKTLRDLIKGQFKLRNVLLNSIQICDALSAAHKVGIIHRDIKPENVMIRKDGYAKILDFGLAKLTDPGQHTIRDMAATVKGVIIGTPAYMSPSQISDDTIDHRTDLWSCGVVLYEFLTGKNPFKRSTKSETFQAILSEAAPPPSSINPEVPEELDRILFKLLEKDPGMGYQSAADLRADLKRVKREIDSSPSWSSRTSERTGANSRNQFSTSVWKFAAAGLAPIIAISLAAFVYLRPAAPDSTEWSKAKNDQLTTQPGTEFFPSISPDGKTFVFASDADGDLNIYWQRIGGKNPQNITKESTKDDTQPSFSPDGEKIAFRSERSPAGIYVMGATGENAKRVSDFGYHPSWSPDGSEIVVSTEQRELPNFRNPKPSSLWIINVESGEKRQLIEMDAMQPSWSPDGKWIAFWFMQPGGSKRDIAIVSAAGGDAVVISKEGQTNWNPVWSPNGKYLYFISDRAGNMGFWRVGINDGNGQPAGEPEAVVTPSKFNRHLAFSADGKKMIYVQSDFRSNIQAIAFDAAAELTKGEPFWITTGDRVVSRPDMSPDGKFFVTRLPRRTQDDIALIIRETGEIKDLTDDEPFDRFPRFSPDSKTIAFISDRSGNHEIWTINADGTDLKQITRGNFSGVSFPHWSPDGTRMLFRADNKNFFFDPRAEWAAQTPQQLPAPENNANFVVWDWSPDGKKLIGTFSDGTRGTGIFHLETSTYEKISDLEEIPMWLSDSRRITFGRGGKAFIFDTVAKKEKPIPLPQAEMVSTVSVSRDSSLLYFTIVSKESDIWLLDMKKE